MKKGFLAVFFILFFGSTVAFAQSADPLVGNWISLRNGSTMRIQADSSVAGVFNVTGFDSAGEPTLMTFNNFRLIKAGNVFMAIPIDDSERNPGFIITVNMSENNRLLIISVPVMGTSVGMAFRRN